MTSKLAIGFIGTGVMGKSMALHLLKSGHPLRVYNRTRARAEDLIAQGAKWAETPGELAAGSDLVITVVGFPRDVEEIYLGSEGLIERAKPGAVLVDMTTSDPTLADRIFQAGKKRGVSVLDAPVSGGDVGAREARLSIMVGGDEAAFQKALPVFSIMGKNIVYQGPAGSGQHTKMVNQIAIAGNMMGICEALAYAKVSGLDPEKVLQSIGGGAAGSWSLNQLGPRILKGDYSPGFFVKHFIKDLEIALKSAQGMKLDTPALKLALELYRRLKDQGGGEYGTQALFKLYAGA